VNGTSELHIGLHAWGDAKREPTTAEIRGRMVTVCRRQAASVVPPLSVSFDEAVERLSVLPRMFVEADGSFVWVGIHEGDAWQVDGQLHDTPAGLGSVELKLAGRGIALTALLDCFRSGSEQLLIRLIREGVYLDEAALRQLCPDSV
jgi:hypothetical protein